VAATPGRSGRAFGVRRDDWPMTILTEDMLRVVREHGPAFVATVCPDGTPNLSPKGTTTMWDEEHLVFADLGSPQTMANLRQNPAVEINVVDTITRTGYRFKGHASVHTDGEQFAEVVAFYERERGLAPSRVLGVAIVTVESAAELVSPAYDVSTREEIVARNMQRFERVYGVRVSS
jgi:predicted pyridoxine 5'-phosphate oxidase superfamily flavin-nucleotide-binding protein